MPSTIFITFWVSFEIRGGRKPPTFAVYSCFIGALALKGFCVAPDGSVATSG